MKYDVFISFRNVAKEKEIATALYNELCKDNSTSVFLSDISIHKLGESAFKKSIDAALDEADVLVVIGTSIDNINSNWVKYEWEGFHSDILSGIKKHGEIVTYISEEISFADLPRSLRYYESYQIGREDVVTVAEFIERIIEQKNRREAKTTQQNENYKVNIQNAIESLPERETSKKSVYSSSYGLEFERLQIQANNSLKSDMEAISHIKRYINKIQGISVLDVGSAYGFVAHSRFGNDESVEKVICIDNNEEVIDIAKVIHNESKLSFYNVDIEADNFEEEIATILSENDLLKFDIIFSALTLLHLDDPQRFLRRIRKYLSKDGFIVLRGSDDDSKLCYPHSQLMKEIINKSINVQGEADRLNGQKLFSELKNTGYGNIRVLSRMRDTSGMSMDEKEDLFNESFAYRINCFKKLLDNNPQNKKIEDEYNNMKYKLKEMENCFYELNFWYAEYDYIAIAQIQE